MRRKEFYGLLSVSDRGQTPLQVSPQSASQPRVRKDLIALLNLENQAAAAPLLQGPELEEYFNYYGDVIAAVASLRDSDAIPALADAISTGNLATTALARFGDLSLPAVIGKLESPDPVARAAALFTAEKMLELRTLSGPGKQAKLKSIFLKGLRDSDPSVRTSAVYALGSLDDVSVLPVIKTIARSDPFALKGQAEDGKDLYPVRHAAAVVLGRMALRGKSSDIPAQGKMSVGSRPAPRP
jgi:HEAT repeat protein